MKRSIKCSPLSNACRRWAGRRDRAASSFGNKEERCRLGEVSWKQCCKTGRGREGTPAWLACHALRFPRAKHAGASLHVSSEKTLVPGGGIEPPWCHHRGILSPVREVLLELIPLTRKDLLILTSRLFVTTAGQILDRTTDGVKRPASTRDTDGGPDDRAYKGHLSRRMGYFPCPGS
jgi:hypothetical protein